MRLKDPVRSHEIYRDTVLREFAWLKETSRLDEAVARGLPVADGAGRLIPLCELHAEDEKTIGLLTDWRDANQRWFPTQFEVTLDGTARWLREHVLDMPDRILFLLLDRHGRPIGHLGFAYAGRRPHEIWFSNFIRGEPGTPRLMTGAAALWRWAWDTLGARRCVAPPLAYNERSIRLLTRLGFRSEGTIPLRRVEDGPRTCLLPRSDGDEAPPDGEFVVMTDGVRFGPGELRQTATLLRDAMTWSPPST